MNQLQKQHLGHANGGVLPYIVSAWWAAIELDTGTLYEQRQSEVASNSRELRGISFAAALMKETNIYIYICIHVF